MDKSEDLETNYLILADRVDEAELNVERLEKNLKAFISSLINRSGEKNRAALITDYASLRDEIELTEAEVAELTYCRDEAKLEKYTYAEETARRAYKKANDQEIQNQNWLAAAIRKLHDICLNITENRLEECKKMANDITELEEENTVLQLKTDKAKADLEWAAHETQKIREEITRY